MTGAEIALSAALGIALAAATGFRLFVPLLVTAVAAKYGFVALGDSFGWLGSTAAITILAIAAAVEVAAYAIPIVDNLLDKIAGPLALVAGTLLAAAVMTELPPAVRWTLAVVAGGGAATVSQGITSLLRAKSTALTGGLGNPVVAGGELVGALGLSILALLAPLFALVVVVIVVAITARWAFRRFVKRRNLPDLPRDRYP